ncbi:hypothetical protein EHS25_004057 [Saitozyma podzolica]|uniref:Uncharacterized protein n=1 Tax=Saitozyma podzolica TaxID=1890683 RepID=A0A427YSZ4_9TREE|nr:hypothetical protein EHS25_004057 [Saitozyma podzolica]
MRMPALKSGWRGPSRPIPDEVIELIAAHLEAAGAKRTIANLARTSRTHFQLVAPFLYRHLELTTQHLHPLMTLSFDEHNAYMSPRPLRDVRLGRIHPAHPSSTIREGWYLSRIETLAIQHRHLDLDVPGLRKLASSYSSCIGPGLEHQDGRAALLMPRLERLIVLTNPPDRGQRRHTQHSEEARMCGRDALVRILPSLCRPSFVCGHHPLPRLPRVDQRGQFVDDTTISTSDDSGLFNLLLQNLRGVREVVIHDLSSASIPLCPGAVIRVLLAPEASDYLLSAVRTGARSYQKNCKWEIVGVDQHLNSSGGSVAGAAGGQAESHGSEIESYLLDNLEGPHRLWRSRAARQGKTIPDLIVMLRDMLKVLSPEDVVESPNRPPVPRRSSTVTSLSSLVRESMSGSIPSLSVESASGDYTLYVHVDDRAVASSLPSRLSSYLFHCLRSAGTVEIMHLGFDGAGVATAVDIIDANTEDGA